MIWAALVIFVAVFGTVAIMAIADAGDAKDVLPHARNCAWHNDGAGVWMSPNDRWLHKNGALTTHIICAECAKKLESNTMSAPRVMYHPDRAVSITPGDNEPYPVVDIGDVTIFPASAGQCRELAAAFTSEAERVEAVEKALAAQLELREAVDAV